MDVDKLRVFLTVVNSGSFNKASEKTGYTQAGISYITNAVENELGIRLLHRTFNGVSLTEDGTALIKDIRKVVDSYDGLQNHIHSRKTSKSANLHIASIDSVSIKWIPEAVRLFNEQYPRVKVDVITGTPFEINEWIGNGSADLGLSEKLWASGDYKWIKLEEDPFFGIFPRSFNIGRSCTMKDLDGQDFFIPDFRRDQNVPLMIRKSGITVSYMYDRASTPSILKRIASGNEVSLMNALALDLCGTGSADPEKLPQIIPLKPYEFRELGIVMKAETSSNDLISAFSKCIKNVVITDDSWKDQKNFTH